MGRLNLRGEDEEHNFWQNYTDLMSGFLIVFIIASLVAYNSYKMYVDLYHEKGITEGNINDIIVNAELYNKIKEFQDAQRDLDCEYFRYNSQYNRFECTVDVRFAPDRDDIPVKDKSDLVEAGKELEAVLAKFQSSTNIAFKIVIEGRAARPHDIKYENIPSQRKHLVETLSYNRARNLYNLWLENGLFCNVAEMNGEVFISGSGFDGQGRYSGYGDDGEDRNKTFIIQIIPYIKY